MNSDRGHAPRNTSKDWVLVQQAIAGNADAREALFTRNTGKLYGIALSLLQNKEDAEDSVQEGLLKAYTNLRSFEGRSSFSTWLTRIVINAALMARRRKTGRSDASLDEILENQPELTLPGVVDARPDPEKLCAEVEIKAVIKEHVRQLTPALQVAYRLVAMDGHSTIESRRALGISASALKSRISRARWKLVHELRRSL